MTINSTRDLKTAIDGGWETTAPINQVLDTAVKRICGMADCPKWGEDWTDFLNSLRLSDIIAEADD